MNRLALIAFVALGFAAPVNAEPMPYDIDAGHSRIWFDVNHQGYSIMRGLFRDFGGTFNYDASDPTASSLDITIDAASINMFHDGLNDHLKRDDFFGVETNPTLHFVSTGIESTGDNQFVMQGDLTILGETNSVSLEVVQNQFGQTRNGANKVGFSASAILDRTDYGMAFGAPNIGADVSITIQIEATHGGDAPAGGMGMGQ
jgi:polyisoprenoid-binding protein YceI